jgi:hypothetical protein
LPRLGFERKPEPCAVFLPIRSIGLLLPLMVFLVPIYLSQSGVNLNAGFGNPMLARSWQICRYISQALNIKK